MEKDLRSLIEQHLRQETPKGKGWVDPTTKEDLRRAAERAGSLDVVLTTYAKALDEADERVLRTAHQAMDWLKEFTEQITNDETLFQLPVLVTYRKPSTIASVDLSCRKNYPIRCSSIDNPADGWQTQEFVKLCNAGYSPVPLPVFIHALPHLTSYVLPTLVTSTFIQAHNGAYTITNTPQWREDGALKYGSDGLLIPDDAEGSQRRVRATSSHDLLQRLENMNIKTERGLLSIKPHLRVEANFDIARLSIHPAVIVVKGLGNDTFSVRTLHSNDRGRFEKESEHYDYATFGMRSGVITPSKTFDYESLNKAFSVFETIGSRQGGPYIKGQAEKAERLLRKIADIRRVYRSLGY